MRLNRAVAVGEARGPETGLGLLAGLDDLLPGDHRVAAARAELAQRAGDIALARLSYRKAFELCANEVERDHLRRRLEELPGLDR